MCLEKSEPVVVSETKIGHDGLWSPQAGRAVARRGAGSGRAQRSGDGRVAGGAAGGAPGALRRRRWAAAGDTPFRPPSQYTDSLWKRITRAYHSWGAHLVISGGDGRPGLGFRVYNFRCAALDACIHVQCICLHGWKPGLKRVRVPLFVRSIQVTTDPLQEFARFVCHVLIKEPISSISPSWVLAAGAWHRRRCSIRRSPSLSDFPPSNAGHPPAVTDKLLPALPRTWNCKP